MSTHDKEQKLLEIIRNLVEQDKKLREQYQMGDKFRFIHDRLHALLKKLQEELTMVETAKKLALQKIDEGDILVYVHIYNTQGSTFSTWQKMLLPSLFYEYSINRPIYSKKEYIEALLHAKNPRIQHAYLTIAVNPDAVFQSDENTAPKDAIGNPLIKVKEGSLRLEKLATFTHEGQNYSINDKGELIKKTNVDALTPNSG
ncbi:MAG: hypothetical protein A3E83_04065 [Gammaproteobacteria bacterium RIFCSPHIGHO2_12_FULL_41_20]|nr:MAG: hypothetical protein A3E83_04065 [Gammaproteobacteria bacterium RIFCSPHIGHO2_12_FULL_41_20]